ncbi:MAG: DNA translocase FtsK [Lachnospiraceae bacterium]|nr:DNA translocase FtsK [Lachnospiraceae bacterium]
MAYVLPPAVMIYMIFYILSKKGPGRLKIISAVFIVLLIGMLMAFFAGTDFEFLVSEKGGRVKALYEMQSGGGAFFGLPALFFYSLFGKAGSYLILFLLLLISVLLFMGRSFLDAFSELLRNMGNGIAEGYHEVRNSADEFKNRMESDDGFYDEEDEPESIEEFDRQREKARNRKFSREMYGAQDEKRRRREEKEMRRREELERKDDERILSTSGNKRKNIKMSSDDDGRGSLDDIHEITLLSDTQKLLFQQEAHIQDEMIELTGDMSGAGELLPPLSSVSDSYAEESVNEEYEDDHEELPPEVVYVDEPAVKAVEAAEKTEDKPADEAAGQITPLDTQAAIKADDNVILKNMPTPVTERSHKSEAAENNAPTPKKKSGKYIPPSLDLLEKNEKRSGGDSDRQLQETAALLQQTLASFGITVEVKEISQGPSVTRFELQMPGGVKVQKIVNLADDIKLNLAAQDIRIEAPIPGKSMVGVEIPNKERQTVKIRDLIDSREFKRAESKLSYVVGKDISGQIIISDIAKMPHMLIAGSTGSGKSVFTNSIIMSILYKANPDEVKLMLIDPKIVEFSVYNGIPHLLLPVVTDPRQASAALAWAVAEMTRRYKLFADANVRAITAYNELAEVGEGEKLPQIVIVVDELADLMMVASKEVEESICRLAQLARAAGIHLIVATQRPSVDVITGLIKANMPSRVGLKVASGIDSRTILDMVGAERLLGNGDMLFYPQGIPKPLRVQGAFVKDTEVQRVVEALKAQSGEDVYDKEIVERITNMSSPGKADEADADTAGGSDHDAYYADACRFVAEKEKASTSMIQRVFKVGFNRAARMLDKMEQDGIVGPEDGTKPRKILMTREEIENYISGLG